MPARFFIDTNLLIYRYSKQDDGKRAMAARLLTSGECTATVQVLNEFCNVIRRKFPAQFPAIESTLAEIQSFLPIREMLPADTLAAVRICQRHGFQYFDALILACAQRMGCEAVLSEDMQHGFVLDGRLAIVNPFLL
jgi:predicted nucleic acid-binding protein